MMDQLISIGTELEGRLRETFLNRNFSHLVRGVSIDVDEYWEASELINGYNYEWLYPVRYRPVNWQSSYFNEDLRARVRTIREISNQPVDFSYRPNNWEEYCKEMHYPNNANPVIIRVYLRTMIGPDYDNLPTVFNGTYPISYEVRGEAKLVNNKFADFFRKLKLFFGAGVPGKAPAVASDFGKEKGTIGGLLRGAASAKMFLVTCGHVLGGVGRYAYDERNLRKKIGIVVSYNMPPAASYGTDACSEFINPDLKSVDASVAELHCRVDEINNIDKLPVPNKISPARDIRINDIVTFTGKTSGKVQAKIGPLTLWYAFELDGIFRCFGRVFELKPAVKQYVYEPMARPGDSGSWVLYEKDSIIKWYGMVTAEENGSAYACFAEFIVESTEITLGETMKCLGS